MHSDIYFSADDTHHFLPWLIGIMVGLAVILLCLGITINSWVIGHHGNYANSFTVNIPAGSGNISEKLSEITATLQQTPGVVKVERLDDDTLKSMLEPWLGNVESFGKLPLPAVFDVTLDASAAIDYAALRKTLATVAPGVEIDAHERWVAAFSHFSAAVQGLLAVLAALVVGALAIMVAFTSRASLKLHNRTVHLLHSIGAEDRYITRQFQREAFLLVIPGAFLGSAAAGFLYWAAGMYTSSLQTSAIPSLSIGLHHVVLLVVMPIACGALAWSVARLSVTRQLQRAL